MNSSLYEISTELKRIYDSVIENDGEITQEEYNNLVITKENLKEKVEDYCKLIALTNYDVDACKCEKKRINTNQQVKVNLVAKLKERLLEAIIDFGDEKEGKNGTTYSLDAGTFKLFTRNAIKFVEEEYRVNLLKNTLLSYFKELFVNKVLVADEYLIEDRNKDEEVNSMLAAVNAIAKSTFETDLENNLVPPLPTTEWVNFTVEDLKALNIKFTFGISAYDLITDGTYIAQAYSNELGVLDSSAEVNPINGVDNITLGTNQLHTSLTIK